VTWASLEVTIRSHGLTRDAVSTAPSRRFPRRHRMELEHELVGMDMSLGRAPIPWDAGSGYYTAAHEDASHASAFLVPDIVAARKDRRYGGSAPRSRCSASSNCCGRSETRTPRSWRRRKGRGQRGRRRERRWRDSAGNTASGSPRSGRRWISSGRRTRQGPGGGGGGDAAKDKREAERLRAELAAERRGAAEKDAALRKYEGFYRKVKARNKEKKRAKQQQQGQRA